jgi:hypothetical protein
LDVGEKEGNEMNTFNAFRQLIEHLEGNYLYPFFVSESVENINESEA